ncbi:MAG TPA: hypothetical protein PKD34_02265 [Candidatus Doudnabacteria bacterium]|nr:hypothetical protein [Candidatus Doudnabacteria bacterium]
MFFNDEDMNTGSDDATTEEGAAAEETAGEGDASAPAEGGEEAGM